MDPTERAAAGGACSLCPTASHVGTRCLGQEKGAATGSRRLFAVKGVPVGSATQYALCQGRRASLSFATCKKAQAWACATAGIKCKASRAESNARRPCCTTYEAQNGPCPGTLLCPTSSKPLQAKKLDEIHAEAHAELGMVPATLLPTLETLQPLPRSQRDEVELFPALRGGELFSRMPTGGYGGGAAVYSYLYGVDLCEIHALNGSRCTHHILSVGKLNSRSGKGAAPLYGLRAGNFSVTVHSTGRAARVALPDGRTHRR